MARQPGAPAEAGDGAAHYAAPQLAQPAARAVHAVAHYHTLAMPREKMHCNINTLGFPLFQIHIVR